MIAKYDSPPLVLSLPALPLACSLIFALLLAVAGLAASSPAHSQIQNQTQQQIQKKTPTFSAIKATARVRRGPSTNYPTLYRMMPRWFPVEVIDSFDNWRQIRHLDNDSSWTSGWTHISNLSHKRRMAIMTTAERQALRRRPHLSSPPRAWMDPRAVANLVRCQPIPVPAGAPPATSDEGWCLVRADDVTGWIEQRHLWGVAPGEVLLP